jgi:hypothetical protein
MLASHENFQINEPITAQIAKDTGMDTSQARGLIWFPSAISVPAADVDFLAIFVGGNRLVAGWSSAIILHLPFHQTIWA